MSDRLDTAALLFSRSQSGENILAAQKALESWCASDQANMAAMQQIRAAWGKAGAAETDPEMQDVLAEMRARYNHVSPSTAHHFHWKKWAIAASVAMAVMVPAGLWLGQLYRTDHADMAESRDIADANNIITNRGAVRQSYQLADGSHMTLDVGSTVHIAYSDKERAIQLKQGRAYFAVEKNKARPFVVSAGQLTATAVGTEFDVHLSPGREEVITSEGVVRVVSLAADKNGHHTTFLNAGMKLTQVGKAVTVRSANLQQEVAWTSGKIVFSSHCLSNVAQQMNRYGKLQLSVDNNAANIAISGVFDLDNAEGLATALQQQGLVKLNYSNSGKITLTRDQAGIPAHCVAAN
ncbi:MAG: iron dicitrate transport regulator FecR [Sphingobium sp.]|nr:iron dicitrate transport regulator FecR [Sphingobium sp.]